MTVTQPGPYVAGMFAEIRCSVTLNDTFDTPVDVEVLWLKNGIELSESVRVMVMHSHLVGPSLYHSLLQFSTLSSSTDSGLYTCVSNVFPTENSNYISNSTGEASLSLHLTGMLILFEMFMIIIL